MSIKETILNALGDSWGDFGDELAVDLLVEAYQRRGKEIARLESENSAERIKLHDEEKRLHSEFHKIRSEPLWCAAGVYYFRQGLQRWRLMIQGKALDLCEVKGGFDFKIQEVSQADFEGTR
jgi:hypothetical protein